MQRYNTRAIDKTNKVIVPGSIILKMGLKQRPEFYLYPAGYLLILQKYNKPNIPDYAVEVRLDELKRITVPEDIMDKMNWKVGDTVSFYFANSEMVIIRLEAD